MNIENAKTGSFAFLVAGLITLGLIACGKDETPKIKIHGPADKATTPTPNADGAKNIQDPVLKKAVESLYDINALVRFKDSNHEKSYDSSFDTTEQFAYQTFSTLITAASKNQTVAAKKIVIPQNPLNRQFPNRPGMQKPQPQQEIQSAAPAASFWTGLQVVEVNRTGKDLKKITLRLKLNKNNIYLSGDIDTNNGNTAKLVGEYQVADSNQSSIAQSIDALSICLDGIDGKKILTLIKLSPSEYRVVLTQTIDLQVVENVTNQKVLMPHADLHAVVGTNQDLMVIYYGLDQTQQKNITLISPVEKNDLFSIGVHQYISETQGRSIDVVFSPDSNNKFTDVSVNNPSADSQIKFKLSIETNKITTFTFDEPADSEPNTGALR